MSEIDFLGHKNNSREAKSAAGETKPEVVWSRPEKQTPAADEASFSFSPFKTKQPPAEVKAAPAVDHNKIRQSRQEILRLIKRHENSQPPNDKSKNFLSVWGDKFKKQPSHKEVLLDYQRVFNQEKDQKNQAKQLFGNQPADGKEAPVLVPKPEAIKSSAKAEKKPRVLETNLINEAIVTFFDWQEKIIPLISAILAPIVAVAAIYYGIAFYQKSNQLKNLEQVQKFKELERTIIREETGIKEINVFGDKLKTVNQIFGQHLYWTNFFKFLEDNTRQNVYFTGFTGDTGGSYALEALAASYGDIAEQVKVFKNNKYVTQVEASGGEMAGGNETSKTLVKFILKFSISKKIFTE